MGVSLKSFYLNFLLTQDKYPFCYCVVPEKFQPPVHEGDLWMLKVV